MFFSWHLCVLLMLLCLFISIVDLAAIIRAGLPLSTCTAWTMRLKIAEVCRAAGNGHIRTPLPLTQFWEWKDALPVNHRLSVIRKCNISPNFYIRYIHISLTLSEMSLCLVELVIYIVVTDLVLLAPLMPSGKRLDLCRFNFLLLLHWGTETTWSLYLRQRWYPSSRCRPWKHFRWYIPTSDLF